MKTIEVYRFDELPEDVQHKVHRRAGYIENPWEEENWDSWKSFIKDVFPDVVKDWSYGYRDTWITCYANDWSTMRGEELRDYLSDILGSLDEFPTGYCMDACTYGYVRNNLERVVKEDMTARRLVRETFDNFCEAVERDVEYYQSFEYFAEEAECNERYYTKDGQEVNV